ncbi:MULTISPECIES: cysteine--tRNA ligase [Exiguobacterium]|uniref:Cysteine--tRNA ligase n=1 Tax=Exiguobacterium sp. (strain ATCC BAA-1283 / AT1b) TaxID=360911 RepID=SYC_EXISA|nr:MULTISPECIES: cysteine--tRNA ligase [Exiguobacterium]C4KZR7.1 RecName: Full=Cysteine--tRNA ligase; AltName: Full=Cysteinyl-tRNA synthetase; Short=CysRS [Exiguobacterium sp. AT1b]ACQ70580.1 cysteinyl-tRNA synthetase [Exiguobacterium sp. AT1b]MCC9626624.1 cysteine--tRNA ligase [Thalassospira sp. MA62]MCM3280799.1 cysteine--tRNA ligase [Exiguobacterium sp. MER 193]
MIQLYNSLTNKKEPFVPIVPGKVSMYVCGPTVYNYIHVGNARPAIAFDTVRRYLTYRGYEVKYVLNFTDVDDKIIRTANELGEDTETLTNRYIEAYLADTGALNVQPADVHPRVTDTMEEIIEFIRQLETEGFAYESEGDVYFRTKKFETYGKLSQQSIEDLRAGSRVDVGEKKEDPLDFVLWKAAKPDEPSWDSPWGKGRPGWHIECSAMAKKHLGTTIDIHAGGHDLKFPHHENEIAQSEACNHAKFANYWLHNGFINIENEKMSKSLGNFLLVHEALKEVDPMVLRFFMLSVHYRHPINYSRELIEQAANGWSRIKEAYQNIEYRLSVTAGLGEASESMERKLESIKASFIESMDDDINTANAVTVLFDLAREANIYAKADHVAKATLEQVLSLFDELTGVLGLTLAEEKELLDAEIDQLIQERNDARAARNFARADEIRDLLKEQNIQLEDTAQGVRWKRL